MAENISRETALDRAKRSIEFLQGGGFALDEESRGTIIDCDPKTSMVEMEFQLTRATQNPAGNTHGATTAWLSDLCMAVAISVYGGRIHGTTIDLNVNYISNIPAFSKVTVKAYSMKIGGYARRARADFFVDGMLVASSTGNYTGIKIDGERRIDL